MFRSSHHFWEDQRTRLVQWEELLGAVPWQKAQPGPMLLAWDQ